VYLWDEAKREANIAKHGLDFAEAYLVYENTEKVTLESARYGEARSMDIALVELHGAVLALVYLEHGEDIRVISFRPASRTERRLYAGAKEQN
jgi:uncharacterized DUF497 family protein